jgi:hypothetical protein
MTSNEKLKLTDAARSLFTNLQADIQNASTRIEHIRLTTLAQEAENLLAQIQDLQTDN